MGPTVDRRAALLEATRTLALTKGFPASSVEEICESAGVTKGSFYHHFGSKDELGAATLSAFFGDVVAAFTAGDWAQAGEPVARLQAFLDHAADVSVGPVLAEGCLLGCFAVELAETSSAMRATLTTMFGQLRDVVAGLVREAAHAQGVDLEADRYADQFLAVVEGSILLGKARGDRSAPRAAVQLYAQHLDLLLGVRRRRDGWIVA